MVGVHLLRNTIPVFRALATLLALSAPLAAARSATTTVLHSFDGDGGSFPNAGLMIGSGGTVYGTTVGGGGDNGEYSGGVAFSLTPSSSGPPVYNVLHVFGAVGADGRSPHSRLVTGRDGNLYGTTYEGGTSNCGTVYRLLPPAGVSGSWSEQVLYNFSCGSDGAYPRSELVIDSTGHLYGTATMGGTAQQGTVFRLTPPASGSGKWAEQTLYRFVGADGRQPFGGLLGRTVNGVFTLFGTTANGGDYDQGAVFSLATPASGSVWRFSLLYSFSGGLDGGVPVAALVANKALVLYGTTQRGGLVSAQGAQPGGTVFRLAPPAISGGAWTLTTLHRFAGGVDGSNPLGAVVQQSAHLIGTTAGAGYGGCAAQCGTVFMLTPNGSAGLWNEVILQSFDGGADGDLPSAEATMTQSGGGVVSFYGVTERGGTDGYGTIFQVTP